MPRTITPDRIFNQAIADRAFHSAVVLVVKSGQPCVLSAYGQARIASIFDLASLTKPLATAAMAMVLVDTAGLSLSSEIVEFLPELKNTALRKIRISHLLSHCSGLPAWRPFYRILAGVSTERAKQDVVKLIGRLPILDSPGAITTYSDLGYILLGIAFERMTKTRFDRLCQGSIYGPLGLNQTFFLRREETSPKADMSTQHLIPTQYLKRRGGRLAGVVHDDNAWALGGCAGHAGLFSSAYDVHLMVRELLRAYHGRASLFSPNVVRRFWSTRSRKEATWALGWDRTSGRGSSAGSFAGPAVRGHLGYTGTSLWIDIERESWIILFTNRVYHGINQRAWDGLRARLHTYLHRNFLSRVHP